MFIIDTWLFCFRSNKVGATYQKLMNHTFKDLIDKKVGAYKDDMVDKTTVYPYHLKDLHDIFDRLA